MASRSADGGGARPALPSRRAALCVLGAAAAGGCLRAAGPDDAGRATDAADAAGAAPGATADGAAADASGGPACTLAPDLGGSGDGGAVGWIVLPLDRYPALRAPGGSAVVQVPEALLDAIVIHTPDGCLRALWRICPHGGCYVEYRPEKRDLRCPCHASRFDEEGQLLQGPADRGLRAFPAARAGDSLLIGRS